MQNKIIISLNIVCRLTQIIQKSWLFACTNKTVAYGLQYYPIF